MKLAAIGFGQAGGKIVDRFLAHDDRHGSDVVRAAIIEEIRAGSVRNLERLVNDESDELDPLF